MRRFMRRWRAVIIFGVLALLADCFGLIYEYARAWQSGIRVLEAFPFKIAGAVVSLALYVLGLIVVQRSARQRERETYIKDLEEKLRAALGIIIPDDESRRHARVNLMLPETTKSREDVLGIFVSINMVGYPDLSLKLVKGQGCAGVAWEQALEERPPFRSYPVIEPDLEVAGTWDMNAHQMNITRHLRWVVSTPMFDSKDGSFIGVFNLDGTEGMPQEVFDDKRFGELCVTWAAAMAESLVRGELIP